MVNEYEELRKKNIEDNRRILAELGILNPFKPLGRVVKKSVKRKRHLTEEERAQKKRVVEVEESLEDFGSLRGTRRRSSRIQGKAVPSGDELQEEVDKFVEEEQSSRLKVKPNRPNFYGAVSDVAVGTLWLTRMEACHAGVHRPTVAGIHGGEDGAYSIALSGGYEDDIDLGECFTYTGEGGRDLKGTKSNPKNLRTAAQSKDQTLTRGNLALSRNVDTGNPVRVLRGYKLRSPFAPEDGYRYDGIYSVEKAWFTVGLSGYGVWKFALRRSKDQAPPPWNIIENVNNKVEEKKLSEYTPAAESKTAKVKEDMDKEISPDSKEKAEIKVTECKEEDSVDKSPVLPSSLTQSTTTADNKVDSDSGIDSDACSVGSFQRSNSEFSEGQSEKQSGGLSDGQSSDKSDGQSGDQSGGLSDGQSSDKSDGQSGDQSDGQSSEQPDEQSGGS